MIIWERIFRGYMRVMLYLIAWGVFQASPDNLIRILMGLRT